MKEYIVSKLIEEYSITHQEALLFFYQVAERHQLENLIVRIDDFISFEQMKKYFLGGE